MPYPVYTLEVHYEEISLIVVSSTKKPPDQMIFRYQSSTINLRIKRPYNM